MMQSVRDFPMNRARESKPAESLLVLMNSIVDYAGLFPPSAVSMPEAVINFATYKNSNYRNFLGRFVVPVDRLAEFTEHARDFFAHDAAPWKLSVLANENIHETVRSIEEFNFKHAPYAICDSLEVKADDASTVEKIDGAIPSRLTTYVEIPPSADLNEMTDALSATRMRAKIRTGGVTSGAFPAARAVAKFIRACLSADVPFKATAGLHHPLRCRKPLTYEKDAPTGVMFGFLNVFLAAALMSQGSDDASIDEILEEDSIGNLRFDDTGVTWRGENFIDLARLRFTRENRAISFGSCSFEEPVADLRELGLL